MMPLFMPRRKMGVDSALIIALLVGIAGFVPARQTLAQAIAYKVTELSTVSSAGQVPCRLNNLGDLVGRAGNVVGEELEPRPGATAPCNRSIWVFCPAATIVRDSLSTTREKSQEPQTPATPSFHSFGCRQGACDAFPCCAAIIAARHSASISTGMWLDILPAQMAPELFCGREAQVFAISVLCPEAVTAGLVQLTTPMRSPGPPRVPPASVRSYGQKPAMYAILGLCREILQARLPQSIMLVRLSDTRKAREACTHFCGRQRLECRISECYPEEIRAERSISMTWVLWLGALQARPVITRSSGPSKRA